MKLGAYSPELKAGDVEGVFALARSLGFTQMQYDFVTSHGETLPGEILPGEIERIAAAARQNGVDIVAVNGTFNMIDPNKYARDESITRFRNIARACRGLECDIITLCTGSRSPVSGWRWHPDSVLPDAWEEMAGVTWQLLDVAKEYGVTLGVETEASNVVCTIERTRRYLDEMGSPNLKVIMDCANLFQAGTARPENVRPTIQKAFDMLGGDIILSHGKDILEGDGIKFCGAGQGIVDFDFYLSLLKKIGYDGGMILHGLHDERDFSIATAFLRERTDAAGI